MLLSGATVATLDPPQIETVDLRIKGDRITERGNDLVARDGEEVVDLAGKLLMPGLVNAHTHLYRSLARGMPPVHPPARSYVDRMEREWWRFDRALDEESVYYTALVGAIEAALTGTTVLINQHSSPAFISGSLATVRRAVEEVGLRSLHCYEVSDRAGPDGVDAALEENRAFLQDPGGLTRGMIGAHASFTLSEKSMNRLADLIGSTGGSLHIHVAEDLADIDDCRSRFGLTLLERLSHHGLLVSRTLLAHCVHLTSGEISDVHAQGGWIAHNPRSNMRNAVGHAAAASMQRAALGTAGIDQDLFAEARNCYLKLRESGEAAALNVTLRFLVGGQRLAAALFGRPFGKLAMGAPADLVVLNYTSPTPLDASNVAAHLLFGIHRNHVESVLVGGRWIVRERSLVGIDLERTYARAREVASGIWSRMAAASESGP